MTATDGTPDQPWVLTTPSGGSEFTAYRDESLDPPALVVNVGKTELRYHLRCISDLHAMLIDRGDWVSLGNADEQKPTIEGTVEAWVGPSTTPSVAGMESRRVCVAVSPTMCHPSSRGSGLPRWSTTPATTACGPRRPNDRTAK